MGGHVEIDSVDYALEQRVLLGDAPMWVVTPSPILSESLRMTDETGCSGSSGTRRLSGLGRIYCGRGRAVQICAISRRVGPLCSSKSRKSALILPLSSRRSPKSDSLLGANRSGRACGRLVHELLNDVIRQNGLSDPAWTEQHERTALYRGTYQMGEIGKVGAARKRIGIRLDPPGLSPRIRQTKAIFDLASRALQHFSRMGSAL